MQQESLVNADCAEEEVGLPSKRPEGQLTHAASVCHSARGAGSQHPGDGGHPLSEHSHDTQHEYSGFHGPPECNLGAEDPPCLAKYL